MRGSPITTRKPGGQHRAELGVRRQLGHDVGARQTLARDRQHFVEQLGRRDARHAQADEALDHERQRHHRTDEQRPDRPASGLYDRKQEVNPMVREASRFDAMRRGAIMAELVDDPVLRRCRRRRAAASVPRERIRRCAPNNPLLLWKSLWASRASAAARGACFRAPRWIARVLSSGPHADDRDATTATPQRPCDARSWCDERSRRHRRADGAARARCCGAAVGGE